MRARALTAVLVVVWGSWVRAQETGSSVRQTANTLSARADVMGPPATIDDMRWLVGHWKGTGLGGVSEELWSEPAGGVMMGMYRLVINGKPSFYEFIHLAEEQGSLVMKLKHFNPDLTGWEDKDRFVTFRLLKLSPTAAYFGGLTFRRVTPDALEVFLALRDKDGTVREERFELRRQR